MNDEFNKVKQLLRKKDYISICKKDGDGCIVTYPYPKLFYGDKNIPRLIEYFNIQRGQEPGFRVNTTFDKPGQEDRFIAVPEYAMRIYIINEIIACSIQIPINSSLLILLDDEDNEKTDMSEIVSNPSSEEDIKKEDLLYTLITEASHNGFSPEFEVIAEKHGISEGYKIISKFYK